MLVPPVEEPDDEPGEWGEEDEIQCKVIYDFQGNGILVLIYFPGLDHAWSVVLVLKPSHTFNLFTRLRILNQEMGNSLKASEFCRDLCNRLAASLQGEVLHSDPDNAISSRLCIWLKMSAILIFVSSNKLLET